MLKPMTDDQPKSTMDFGVAEEARVLRWYRHSDKPCGQVVVPIYLVDRITAAYERMGFEVKVDTFTPKGNHAS
jgi:hypothetical protein